MLAATEAVEWYGGVSVVSRACGCRESPSPRGLASWPPHLCRGAYPPRRGGRQELVIRDRYV